MSLTLSSPRQPNSSPVGGDQADFAFGSGPEQDDPAFIEITFQFDEGEDAEEKIGVFAELEDVPESVHLSLLSTLAALFEEERLYLHQKAVQPIIESASKSSALSVNGNGDESNPNLISFSSLALAERRSEDPRVLPFAAPISLWQDVFSNTCEINPVTDVGVARSGALSDAAVAAAKTQTKKAALANLITPTASATDVVSVGLSALLSSDVTAGNAGMQSLALADTDYATELGIDETNPANGLHSGTRNSASLLAYAAVDPFDVAYAAVIAAGGEYAKNIWHVGRNDAMELSKLIEKRDQALSKLQEQQSREMEAAMRELSEAAFQTPEVEPEETDDNETAPATVAQHQSHGEKIATLVSRHMADTQAAEQRAEEEIKRAKRKQRQNYRAFIISLYNNEFEGTSGNAHSVLKTMRPSSSPLRYGNPASDLVSREVWIGSNQRKTSYVVRLAIGDVVDLCQRDFSEREYSSIKKVLQNLYSERLSAFVLPHQSGVLADIGGVASTPRVKRFLKACECTTEAHFTSVTTQLRQIHDTVVTALQSQGLAVEPEAVSLQPGDFFVTRHSNLLSVHAAFHLIDTTQRAIDPESAEAASCHYEAGKNPVLDGLRQIILMANRNGVHTLAIPLIFSDSHRLLTQHSMSISLSFNRAQPSAAVPSVDTETAREIESILRTTRFCLSEIATDTDSCLKEVTFMVPQPPAPLLASASQSAQLVETPLVRHCKTAFTNVFQS